MTINIDSKNPEVSLGKLLNECGLTISTAESCTAGGIANKIASVPGSSNYLVGGVVTYATEAKYKLLDVSEYTVSKNNVVSSNVALEMATGVMKLFDTDVSIGITGIAGPNVVDGLKPGTIYICIAVRTRKNLNLPDKFIIKNCNFNMANRSENIENAIYEAIVMAFEMIANNFDSQYDYDSDN